MNSKRDIVLINEHSFYTDSAENHVAIIDQIIDIIENSVAFYAAHELIKRNRITKNKQKVLKALQSKQLKPFYFVVNLN